jgi:hypothetical protein
MGHRVPGATCVAGLVDRFNQHCHKLFITADCGARPTRSITTLRADRSEATA